MDSQLPVIRPNPEALAVLEDLREPLEHRLYGPMRQVVKDVPPPVLTRYPRPFDVRYSDRNTTLTAARYDLDLMVAQDGGLIRAPKSEQRKLKKFEKHGIDPELVWVLREFSGVWRPGETPPRMIGVETMETARTRHVQHLQIGAAAFLFGRAALYTAGAAVAVLTGAAVVAVGAVGVVGLGAAGAASPLAHGLDPLVLGGVVHEETGSVAWVPLAAWDEIPDERGW